MNSLYIILIGFAFIIVIISWIFTKFKPVKSEKKTTYHYKKKEFLIRKDEHEFFDLLMSIIGDDCYVFPQIHLDAFLDCNLNSQKSFGAYSHIRMWSIDYLICDKNYIKPLLAIELDGGSHKQEKRIKRDKEVERILKEANLPLMRIESSKRNNKEEIRNKIFSILKP